MVLTGHPPDSHSVTSLSAYNPPPPPHTHTQAKCFTLRKAVSLELIPVVDGPPHSRADPAARINASYSTH